MSAAKWKTLPFEAAVHSRGSGTSGLPTKEWLSDGKFLVIGQGAEDIEGWTNREDLLLTPTRAVVLYGGHTRRAKHVSQPFVPGPNVKILQPVPAVDSKFLYYFLTQLPVESKGYADHFPLVRKCDVPVPPLAEQQRIVGLLDEAFADLATAQANAEKNHQNARALFESHLQSVFTQRGKGWVEKPLEDLCDFLNGFAFKSGDAVTESQTQLVRMGNLYGNQLGLDRHPVFYPDSFATEHPRYVLEEGDIIMSLTGTTGKEDYGFAVRIPDCGHTLLMNQRIMKFDAIRRDVMDDGYLLHYLRSRCFLDILYPTANGTRQANLSSVTMKLLPVPLCSLQEQKSIAAKLDALLEETQRLAALYKQKQAALAALKQSLLHQAFSGGL